MTVISKLSADDQELNIAIQGRFDFNIHQDFRSAYLSVDAPVDRYVIDFARVTYMDSSALGMLLLLRDFAGGDSADIRLTNLDDDVRNVLNIANFDQLFEFR